MPVGLSHRSACIFFIAAQFLNGCQNPPFRSEGNIKINARSHPQTSAMCRVRQLAFDKTVEEKNLYRASIIAGCDGPYRSYVVTSEEQESISEENILPPPQSVMAMGIRHEKLYQQLILRGVPSDILLQVIDSEEFNSAASEISSQRVM